MQDFINLVKALSDANRLRALCALRNRELCVCQIIELLELAPSTVSKHMSILRQVRLADSKKLGRWMYYRLAGENAPQAVRTALTWVFNSIAESTIAQQDAEQVVEILKCDPEVLCRRQIRK